MDIDSTPIQIVARFQMAISTSTVLKAKKTYSRDTLLMTAFDDFKNKPSTYFIRLLTESTLFYKYFVIFKTYIHKIQIYNMN
jgi:hypothetical protein